MEKQKRVEIIVGNYDLPQLLRLLNQQQINAYTLIPDIKGNGDRGLRDADGLTEAFKNCMLLLYCSIESWEKLKEPLRELIKKVGGMVVLSDCEILLH